MDKISICITTLPDRTKALEQTIASLINQVDRIFLFCHGYDPTSLPDFLEDNPKVEIAYDIEWGDKGDLDKFHSVSGLAGYILTCDDDLIYPPDYVQKMIEAIDRHERKALISAHGSIVLPLPIANYYTDRYAFPCLGDVLNEAEVQIGGTGVMGFHTDIGWDFNYKGMLANMADIHLAIWAREKGIQTFVLPHMAGWIKHSEFVTSDMTIAGKAINNNFPMVQAINQRPDLFNSKLQSKKRKSPKVTIAVVNSRLKSQPLFVKECYDSLRNQTYPNIQIVIIENYDKLITIGKCFNNAVKRAKGKYILFVGDDDFITPDYVTTLVDIAENSNIAQLVGISSYLTLFSQKEDGTIRREARELIPTGMWVTKFLRKYPFKEYLTRYIDTELMDRAKELGFNQVVAQHSYGYFYRSHNTQVSGFKSFIGQHGKEALTEATQRIKQRIKEVEA